MKKEIIEQGSPADSGLFHQTDAAWIIEQFVPVLIALIAVGAAYLSFRYALRQQAKDYQHQFQLKTYDGIVELTNAAQKISNQYMASLIAFAVLLGVNYEAFSKGGVPTDLKHRPEEYINHHNNYNTAITEVMRALDGIKIIEPRLKIFITALSFVLGMVGRSWDQIFESTILYVVKDSVDDRGNTIQIPPEPISQEELERILEQIELMVEGIIKGINWLSDLQVDLQNILLSEVYGGKKLLHRTHTDPEEFVLTVTRYEELRKRFQDATDIQLEQSTVESLICRIFEKHGKE